MEAVAWKSMINFIQDNRWLGRQSNPEPPEYHLKERYRYANPLDEGLSEHGHGMLAVFVELSSCQYLNISVRYESCLYSCS
jgi:hypothetical protein